MSENPWSAKCFLCGKVIGINNERQRFLWRSKLATYNHLKGLPATNERMEGIFCSHQCEEAFRATERLLEASVGEEG